MSSAMKVGDEFWGDWVSDKASTDTQEHRVKYRVAEIVKVHEHGLWGKMIDAPKLEPIELESRNGETGRLYERQSSQED